MSARRARGVDESVAWVPQDVLAVGDRGDCLAFEPEDLARFPACLDPFAEGIKAVHAAMKDGGYARGREDSPFMDLAGTYAEAIPFHTLLKRIAETHRCGLDLGGDDA